MVELAVAKELRLEVVVVEQTDHSLGIHHSLDIRHSRCRNKLQVGVHMLMLQEAVEEPHRTTTSYVHSGTHQVEVHTNRHHHLEPKVHRHCCLVQVHCFDPMGYHRHRFLHAAMVFVPPLR